MMAVLKLATDKAGWGQKRPKGEGQGFAITRTNNAYVAVVCDVAVSRDGNLTIKKITETELVTEDARGKVVEFKRKK